MAVLMAVSTGCTDKSVSPIPPDVKAIVFLQRTPRNNQMGNVFDYTSYEPGGRIVKLEPPTADGQLTVLTSDPIWQGADFMAWDLSFDAQSIVCSARLADSNRYHLFSMNVDGTNVKQLTAGDDDYVYPIFLPGQRILFMTSKNVEVDARQFQDEYERATTAQVGTIKLDGSDEQLGPRNVSHRVAPALLPDGHVLYTEWRHLGNVNDGHLRIMNADMTGMREAFGGEEGARRGTNSYLKARYVGTVSSGGEETYQVVTVATSRDRTLQSGKLLLVNLGRSEATSSFVDLTPQVPGGQTRSFNSVGRYYDAEPISADGRTFVVSWADGVVESEALALANSHADFGLYVFDAGSSERRPLYNDPAYWEVMARPLKARPAPPVTASPSTTGDGFVLSALNVYNSSLQEIPPGAAVKVRLMEGFSGEEGIRNFGTTMFDGQSRYGEVPVQPDGSFAARVPANVPVHMQVIDKFGVAIVDEPIWISGRAGEQRTCGGCHESRSQTPSVSPGQIEAILRGIVDLNVPRAQRVSTTYTYDQVRGVPWDKAIQPIFDAKCVSCHNGDATNPANKSYTITDMTIGTSANPISQTFVFDLRGQPLPVMVGENMTSAFSASYISIMGLGELLGENVVRVEPPAPVYVRPGHAAESPIIEKLNPPQRFPAVDPAVRRYPGPSHPADVGGTELTPDEYYLLILNIDMGGQFFFRENLDSAQNDPYVTGGQP